MKAQLQNTRIHILIIVVVLLGCTQISCKTPNKITKEDLGTELKFPCDEPSLKSDDEYLRCTEFASSADMPYSRQKALLLTQNKLVLLIQSNIENGMRRLASESEPKSKNFSEKNINDIISRANLLTESLTICCEKTLYSKEKGLYTTVVTLEIRKSDIINKLLESEKTLKEGDAHQYINSSLFEINKKK